jgi:uncharacterized NAD-dependent epimerase/dehydratase family protein
MTEPAEKQSHSSGEEELMNDPTHRTAAMRLRDLSRLNTYRRIVLLTEGFSTPTLAKTAISLLRYRTNDIFSVLDSTESGRTANELFGTGGDIPVVDSLDRCPTSFHQAQTEMSDGSTVPQGPRPCDADALFIGIAPPGGKLPDDWRPIVIEALRRGIDVVSGLHDFLSDDNEFLRVAAENGCQLIDVRRNEERETAKYHSFRKGCLRIHTVGHDCSVGKMVVALEVQRELARRQVDAEFVATGQTGIMICGDGIPIDCVVSDFVNGAAESLVKRHEDRDIVLIEGQGSIAHPSFSAVTLGLLHGSAPDGLIFCYEVGRTMAKGLDNVPLLSNRTLIDACESNASLRHPCRVIAIAMNSRNVSAEEAAVERKQIGAEFGLPVCDVYRDGAEDMADAVLALRKELYG